MLISISLPNATIRTQNQPAVPKFTSLPHIPNSPLPLALPPNISRCYQPTSTRRTTGHCLEISRAVNCLTAPVVVVVVITIRVFLTALPFILFFSLSSFRPLELRKLHILLLSIARKSLLGSRLRKATIKPRFDRRIYSSIDKR